MSRFTQQLRITEIFHSIQGESATIGMPTVFVRLTGCPLRCQYCDTAYAFKGGELHDIADILTKIATYDCAYVCVTGGEPLAQPACLSLLNQLCDMNYKVSLETSGAIDIGMVDERVMIVMDIKTPDSLEVDKNLLTNLAVLKPKDQVKFVLCSRRDYDWACEMITKHQLAKYTQVLFSPSWNQLDPTDLANWIVADKLAVRFQVQLHKILWNDEPGH